MLNKNEVKRIAFYSLFIIGIVILVLEILYWIKQPLGEIDKKFREAEQLMFYEISKEYSVFFELLPDDSKILVVSHLSFKPIKPYSSLDLYTYGIRAEVIDEKGETLWSGDYYLVSRQSKADFKNGIWMKECAFYSKGEEELTDDRIFTLLLDGLGDVKNTLKLSLITADMDGTVLVRLHRGVKRNPTEIKILKERLSIDKKEDLAKNISLFGWNFLKEEEKDMLLHYGWERMAPKGAIDYSYHTRKIYYSGFRLPFSLAESNTGFIVTEGRASAINVKGPTKIEITAGRDIFSAQKGQNIKTELKLNIDRLDFNGERVKFTSTISTQHESFQNVFEDNLTKEGLYTYILYTEEKVPIRCFFKGEPRKDIIFGNTKYTLTPEGDYFLLSRDVRNFKYFRYKEGSLTTVNVALYTSSSNGGIIKIASRLVIDKWQNEVIPYEIRYKLLDENNHLIKEGKYKCVTQASLFEFYRNPEDINKWVGNPVNFILRFPKNAVTLKLSSDKTVDFAFYSSLVDDPSIVRPYPNYEFTSKNVRLRYVPFIIRNWQYFKPINIEELMILGNISEIGAQVRLEEYYPHISKEVMKNLPVEVLVPLENTESLEILEKLEENLIESIAKWKNFTFTKLKGDELVKINFGFTEGKKGNIFPSVYYTLLNEDNLGKMLSVELDDKVIFQKRLSTLNGSFILKNIPSGSHLITFTGVSKDSYFFINQPPSSKQRDREIYQTRKIYRLKKDRPLTVKFNKRLKRETLNAIFYIELQKDKNIDEEICIKASIDDSNLSLTMEEPIQIVTWPVLKKCFKPTYNLENNILFKDIVNVKISSKTPFYIKLGEDLKEGFHTVKFTLLNEREEKVWGRFFVIGHEEKKEDYIYQWPSYAMEEEE